MKTCFSSKEAGFWVILFLLGLIFFNILSTLLNVWNSYNLSFNILLYKYFIYVISFNNIFIPYELYFPAFLISQMAFFILFNDWVIFHYICIPHLYQRYSSVSGIPPNFGLDAIVLEVLYSFTYLGVLSWDAALLFENSLILSKLTFKLCWTGAEQPLI